MHSDLEIMRCRVCGLLQAEPPWGEDGKSPTFDYCACCGVEFGYQDANVLAIQRRRQKWIADGMAWDKPNEKPSNWNWREQLSHARDSQLIDP
ncbi:MAG TPA: hypothetical protein VHR72_10755 [Gemmataceae bacterium]|jgi:hypothetical protein|nr:hypothetical protein [Gemmataceae bacterium]